MTHCRILALALIVSGLLVFHSSALSAPTGPDRSEGGLVPNLLIGTVVGPISQSGMMQVQLLQDFSTRAVQTGLKTRYLKQVAAKATELKLRDEITVQGQPLVMAVSDLQAGADDLNRLVLPQPPPKPATPPGPPGMDLPPMKPIKVTTITLNGTVISLKPMKIRTADDTIIQLALAADTVVTKWVAATRADVTVQSEILVQLDPLRPSPTALTVQIGKLPRSTREAVYKYQLLRSKITQGSR